MFSPWPFAILSTQRTKQQQWSHIQNLITLSNLRVFHNSESFHVLLDLYSSICLVYLRMAIHINHVLQNHKLFIIIDGCQVTNSVLSCLMTIHSIIPLNRSFFLWTVLIQNVAQFSPKPDI